MNRICILMIALMIGGCAAADLTPLDRQARYERQVRSCMNSGGVWYEFGKQSGRCDWSPLL